MPNEAECKATGLKVNVAIWKERVVQHIFISEHCHNLQLAQYGSRDAPEGAQVDSLMSNKRVDLAVNGSADPVEANEIVSVAHPTTDEYIMGWIRAAHGHSAKEVGAERMMLPMPPGKANMDGTRYLIHGAKRMDEVVLDTERWDNVWRLRDREASLCPLLTAGT